MTAPVVDPSAPGEPAEERDLPRHIALAGAAGDRQVGFTVCHRGHRGVRIHVDGRQVSIAVPASAAAPVRVRLGGRNWSVPPGRFRLLDPPAR
ncbi:hypothetical protein [Actinacidiphila sp. bgisy160]|uniref:hypothetical protein n=1 Tax=Actinacidiphila sp. bgisy160 TaxID=3413796 RepID=UPI003D72F798